MIAVFGATGKHGASDGQGAPGARRESALHRTQLGQGSRSAGEDVRTALADVTDRSAMEKALKASRACSW